LGRIFVDDRARSDLETDARIKNPLIREPRNAGLDETPYSKSNWIKRPKGRGNGFSIISALIALTKLLTLKDRLIKELSGVTRAKSKAADILG